jgi:hypothetical protein
MLHAAACLHATRPGARIMLSNVGILFFLYF